MWKHQQRLQSLVGFDFALAKYVDMSFKKALRKKYEEWLEFYDCKTTDWDEKALSKIMQDKNIHYSESIYDIDNEGDHECIGIDDYLDIILDIGADNTRKIFMLACKDVREETQQAMEALVHNFNSLHSRAGRMCAG